MTKRKTKEKSQHHSKVQPIKSKAITAGYRQRDVRMDTLRGLLLIVMTIDHFNSPIAKVTYQTFGYVSVAEGFFFLSAYVFSIVYARQAQNLSMLAIASVKRAYLLYRYHIALIVTVFLLAMVFPLFQKAWVFMVGEVLIEQTFAAVIQGLIFINQPVYMDILPMYCVFVLISPFILAGFSRGWIAQVFVVSLALWLLGQQINPLDWTSGFFPGSRAGYFNWFAWQLIWVGGMYLGYCQYGGRSFDFMQNRFFIGVVFVVSLVLFLSRHEWINLGFNTELATWRPDLSWLRLLNFATIVILFSYLLRFIPQNRGIPWVHFIGRYSLQVFSYHVLIFFLLAPISVLLIKSRQELLYALMSVVVVISLSIPALVKSRLEVRRQSVAVNKVWAKGL